MMAILCTLIFDFQFITATNSKIYFRKPIVKLNKSNVQAAKYAHSMYLVMHLIIKNKIDILINNF